MKRKLKSREVAPTRERLLNEQGNLCGICQQPVTSDDAVLDHQHANGFIRAVLHRSCNSLLGKVENNYRRFGVQDLAAFLSGVASYLNKHSTDQTGLLYPTHKTPAEKRVLQAKRRKSRLKK